MTSMAAPQPSKMTRAKHWDEVTEDAYRFQMAGYRDEQEYISIQGQVDRWPDNGFIKKLKRKDSTWYYYNRARECQDKDIHKCKIYAY